MRRTRTPGLLAIGIAIAVLAACSEEPQPSTAASTGSPEPIRTVSSDTTAQPPLAVAPSGAGAPTPVDPPTIGETDEPEVESGAGNKVDAAPRDHAGRDPASTILSVANTRFAQLLHAVVDEHGLVRYDRLDAPTWSASIESIVGTYAKAPMPDDDETRLAMLMNAYNANVLAAVIRERRRGTVASVEDVDGFFDERPITVAGESITLNGLENDLIRPFGDARIHAALVCAAMSCPPLRNEPFAASRLDAQLDEQSRRWVNDPAKNTFEDGTLRVSRIFEWYGGDFETPTYGGVAGFIRKFADAEGPFGPILLTAEVPAIEFQDYDWALNQAPFRDEPEK